MPKSDHKDWTPILSMPEPVNRDDADSFDFVDAGSDEDETAYEYKFDDLMIKSYQTGGSTADPLPTEELTLNYEEVKWTYDESTAAKEGDWIVDG